MRNYFLFPNISELNLNLKMESPVVSLVVDVDDISLVVKQFHLEEDFVLENKILGECETQPCCMEWRKLHISN